MYLIQTIYSTIEVEGDCHLFSTPFYVQLYNLTNKNLKNEKKLKIAQEFFQLFNVVNINKETGIIAGRLLRENKALFLADSLIAATCLQFNLKLLTKNKKDFKKMVELAFV